MSNSKIISFKKAKPGWFVAGYVQNLPPAQGRLNGSPPQDDVYRIAPAEPIECTVRVYVVKVGRPSHWFLTKRWLTIAFCKYIFLKTSVSCSALVMLSVSLIAIVRYYGFRALVTFPNSSHYRRRLHVSWQHL